MASRPGTVKIVDTKIQREVPWDEEAGAIQRGRVGAREYQDAGVTVPRAGQTAPPAGTARIRDTRTGFTSASTAWTNVSRAWNSV